MRESAIPHSTCRSFCFNVVAASTVLGSLLCVILLEGRIKQLLMPVHEALATSSVQDASMCTCHKETVGCALQALEGSWFAKLMLLVLLSKALCTSLRSCHRGFRARDRPLSPAHWSSSWPSSWSGHRRRASGFLAAKKRQRLTEVQLIRH